MFRSLVSLLAALTAPAALIGQDLQLHDVNVQLRSPRKDSVRVFSAVTVRTQQIAVAAGTSLDDELSRRGIHPDAEAYAAVYQLNPTLRGPRPDTAAELLIPVLDRPHELSILVSSGYEAYLTTDFGLKQRIATRIRALPKLESALAEVPEQRFGGGAEKAEIRTAVGDVRQMMVAAGLIIQGRTRPLSHELLVELDGELTITDAVITRLTGPSNQSLSPGDREALLAASAQATSRSNYWIETHGTTANSLLNPFPTGEVHIYVCSATVTSTQPNNQPDTPCRGATSTAGLRVHCRDVAGYYGHLPPNSFPDLSPVERELDVGNFFMWATRPLESNVATDVVRVEVRSGEHPLRVELVLRKP